MSHPNVQVPLQLEVHCPVHADPQDPLQEPLHELHPDPPPGYGSSISHDVRIVGIVTAAIIGSAALAAFLKNARLLILFSSILFDN